MNDDLLRAMRQSIVDGAPDSAAKLARKAVADGIDPLQAINDGFVPGMTFVGQQYDRREMYLPDLLASAEAMKAAIAILEPELLRCGTQREVVGRVVLGTAKGDIHDIGKNLVGTLLSASGFEVFDLGTNATAEQFVTKVKEVNADIVGVSALLTTTMPGQKAVIEALERSGMRPRVKAIIGGASVTSKWASEIGADGYAKNAMDAVALAKSLVAAPVIG